MKTKRIIFFAICIMVVSILFIQLAPVHVYADVGNSFKSSSSGSSHSYSGGGYSSHSSGSYSGGHGSALSLYFLIQIIGSLPFPMNVIAIIVIIGVIYKRFKNNFGSRNNYTNNESNVYNDKIVLTKQEIVAKIRETDADFSYLEFVNFTNDVFIKVQDAWSKRTWNIIRPFESNELFERHSTQLNEFIEKNWTPHLEGQELHSTNLTNFEKDGKYEYITVKLEASVIDYTTDVKGAVIDGNKRNMNYRVYKLLFKRVSGVKTKDDQGTSVTNCPKCGAPNNITSSGKCEYCGSIITTGEYGWVLDEYSQWRE